MNIGEIVREVEVLPIDRPELVPPPGSPAPAESPALDPALEPEPTAA